MLHPRETLEIGYWSIGLFCDVWRAQGHEIAVAKDFADLPPGDLGVMHIDSSQVPAEYARAALERYPRVINGRALDITKRRVSQNLLTAQDDWAGPVIVKSDLNCFGKPELRLQDPRTPAPLTADGKLHAYRLFPERRLVPAEAWANPDLVVERFLPEIEGDAYCVRTWFFLGDRERCRRFVGNSAIVKSRGILRMEPSDVPEPIRAERERLGLDYGKFDFVVHKGRPVLLDANKTPGAPSANARNPEVYADLARGLDAIRVLQ